MGSSIITFRVHSNMKSWLEYAAKGFESEGELLRLILTKAAYDQAYRGVISSFLHGLLDRPGHIKKGDTVVVGVRLPSEAALSIRELAASKSKTVGQWCGLVVLDWYQSFNTLYGQHQGQGDGWITQYAAQFKAAMCDVYAQKEAKQGVEVNG